MTAPPLSRPDLDRLRAVIRERSFSEGETRQLASGRSSAFYFDMKRTLSQPDGLALIADLMLERIREDRCDVLGGLEMGAIPILAAVSLRSADQGAQLPHFWVRKAVKDHGAKNRIEGEALAALSGKTAVMVEDVTTTGGSVLAAIAEARAAGLGVTRVVTVVDRQEGASDALAAEGVRLQWLLTASDFRAGS